MNAANSNSIKTVNMHEAKTHLSRLVEEAVAGKPFIIARAGKPMVRVVAVEEAPTAASQFGFLKGQFVAPANIKDIARDEIEEMFGLKD